mmetsp:Transcript_5219/g.19146  ORF Transcript_5219/g.19146 Transcript_5219/m.19146 type:complete len:536 (+) Transcript_5219:143-1750(+)
MRRNDDSTPMMGPAGDAPYASSSLALGAFTAKCSALSWRCTSPNSTTETAGVDGGPKGPVTAFRVAAQSCAVSQGWACTPRPAPMKAAQSKRQRVSCTLSSSEGVGAAHRAFSEILSRLTAADCQGPVFACTSHSSFGGHRPTSSSDGDGQKTNKKDGKLRVMILMSDTGGGHRASAEALKQGFQRMYGDQYEVDVVDLWTSHTPTPFNRLPKSYSFMVKHSWMYKITYYNTQNPLLYETMNSMCMPFVGRSVFKAFQDYDPDLIVSVHPLMQHVPLKVLRSHQLLNKIPFATVVTDLTTCHPMWFHKHVDLCCVPTEEMVKLAQKAGLRRDQIACHGLPIRLSFSDRLPSKRKLRAQLGMNTKLPSVVLVGGGEGMGPVKATAKALAKQLTGPDGEARGQIVVICGRNKKLASDLKKMNWSVPVSVNGFVSNIHEWMSASDAIITKAGPGTIAESLICGLPIILNGYIPGQEEGNITWLKELELGLYEDDPSKIADRVKSWLLAKSEVRSQGVALCGHLLNSTWVSLSALSTNV